MFLRSFILNLFLLLLVLWSCSGSGSSPGSEAQVQLEWGGLVSLSGVADLRGAPEAPLDNPAVWVPQPVAAAQGWGRAQEGWHPVGDSAVLTYRSEADKGSVLELALMDRRDAEAVSRHLVKIVFNGRAIGGFHTDSGLVKTRIFLPPGLLSDINEVELQFDPAVEEVPGDQKTHLSLIGFGVQEGSGSEGPVQGLLAAEIRDGLTLRISQAGVLVVPWKIPKAAEKLTLEVEGLGGESSVVQVFVVRNSGERVDLLTIEVESGDRVRESFEVSRLQGERITLGVKVIPSGRGGGVDIKQLWVEPGDSSTVIPPLSDPSVESTRRPDIVLIVLDAARGDRFPGWSYPRRVVPNLEELSQDSMTFRRAFSECPTTSCSIPALVTGLSFLPGGEVGRGQQLSDDVTTLAEYLDPLGYRTVGFSATPNNSASRNLHQGFDVFRELWGRGNPDHGPFNMSRLAVEAIRQQSEDEPLFLQLHYLPPHQPYAPGPEFNRFADPDYSGPIRPEMSLGPVNDGRVTLTATDLEQLIGLYDGNLLLADSAVGQVLAALRSAGRFENSLIVITSDHGEAFLEHGMLGHNTTLFDEMLHVPLMIRLPGGEIPEEFDRDRLASTLDVVPTILGYLGTPASTELSGFDLARTTPNPQDPRVLFMRSSHPKHLMVAARTAKWKQISWPRRQMQMLFDLDDDPNEKVNLVSARPHLYAGMGLRIRRHLVEASRRQLESEEVELSPEAEETLRALGYLD